jgi:hypothetical protein
MTFQQYGMRALDLRQQIALAKTDCEAIAELYRRRRAELTGLRQQLHDLRRAVSPAPVGDDRSRLGSAAHEPTVCQGPNE